MYKGFIEVVKYLTEAGADITVRNNYGKTPVLVASENVSIDKVWYNLVVYIWYHGIMLIMFMTLCLWCYMIFLCAPVKYTCEYQI